MKKLFGFWIGAMLLCISAKAQFPYTFSVYYDSYQPLSSGATTLNSTVWFNSDVYSLPIGFDFKIDTSTCTATAIEGGSTLVTDTGRGVISAFYLTDANLIDRGFLDSISSTKSPIRYSVSGRPGQRIFKLEIANAAFFNELIYSVKDDSVNMQIWLYEGTNVVELHYGPSNVSHGYNYFPREGHPTIGYVRDVDYALNGIYYILSGNPSAPELDTIYATDGEYDHQPKGLTYFPPNGVVYRFAPKSLVVSDIANINSTTIYPTSCRDHINVDYNTVEKAEYKIVAINGATTSLNGELQNGLNKIDISSLAAGMYMMELQSSHGKKVQKFVKM